MQHPDESTHAKNTARLLTLGLKNCTIYVGENSLDFTAIASIVNKEPEQYWVVYPNPQSNPLESQPRVFQNTLPKNLILLDGTWRKAKKMWMLNPWLHNLHSWHFDQPPQNQYRIRKTNIEYSLSTLEAAAYSLKCLCKFDSSNLLKLMDAMQGQVSRFVPDRTKP